MKKINFKIALFILLLSLNTMQIYAEDSPQTIYIKNSQDLIKLSKDCTLDRFSRGILVVLQNDIYLNGEPFTPIPIFSGTFDGQGYAIKGLSITVEGSNQGLFRYIEQGGVIKNLKVEGSVTPSGEKSNIGGIAGNNKGLIENSSFSGFVKGKDMVGGITGFNGISGMIMDCVSKGNIYGESKAGGVTGYNAGTILRSTNAAEVNTTLKEGSLNIQDISLDDIDIAMLSKISTDITDLGGIAGVNTGIVQNSQNEGTVGYPHVGYNVGGIAGRQSGYITNCQNYGTIYGRKEVAGIAGQMEPHISVTMSQSKLGRLQKELNTLQSYMTKMIGDTKLAANEMTQNISSIQGDIDKSKGHVQDLFNLTEGFINQDIDEIKTISITAIDAMDRLIPITKSLENLVDLMEDSLVPLKKSLTYLAGGMDEMSELTEQFDELSVKINYSIDKLHDVQDNIKNSNADIKDALTILARGETEGVLDLLKSSFNNLKKAKENLRLSINNLSGLEIYIMDMMSAMGNMTADISRALNYMLIAINKMTKAEDDIDDMFDVIEGLLTYLTSLPPLNFATTNEEFQKSKESLFDSMGDVSNSFSELMATVNVQGITMMDDMQKLTDQLFLVMNLTFDLFDDLSNMDVEVEDIVEDVSGKDIDKKTEGKVSYCNNFGNIEGDINVGGIAGAMSIEVKYDQEEDSSIINKANMTSVFQTSTLIHKCQNDGKITAKKNHAGGIVGNMDLGYIKDCTAAGSIESTDGNYAGGIAGKSLGPIVSSYAKCNISGGDYVGGISGFGKEITSCYSLVNIERARSCIGAIAGNIDKNSNIKENYFVSDTLAGIDGISYGDKAEPIDYEKLISLENIPPLFKEFELSFSVDNNIIYRQKFNFGDPVSKINYPAIPVKNGYYAKWTNFDSSNITFDTIIEAVYTPNLSALESKEKRNDALSIILVEGTFTNEDSLTLLQNKEPQELLQNTRPLEQWSIIIPDDGNTMHTLRYIPPNGEKNIDVYILQNDKWSKVDSRWDGQYLVFKTYGNDITFCAVENSLSYTKYIAAAGAVLLSALFIFVKSRKKHKQPAV